MRIVLISRFPRVDTPEWKRRLAGALLERGDRLAIVYSRAPLADHVREGVRELGLGAGRTYARAALRRGGAREGTATLGSWAREHGVPVSLHRRLGDADCVAALRRLSPDLALLAGADIVPAAVLEVPRAGALNPHYGLLPEYRGMNAAEWSILADDPVGVSVHYVTTGIDTGAVVLQERVPVVPGDDLARVRAKQQDSAARLLLEAVARIEAGTARAERQAPEAGRQYYRMHPVLRERVERKLGTGGYRWMDEPASPHGVDR